MTRGDPWDSDPADSLAVDHRTDDAPDSSALRNNIVRIVRRYKWILIVLLMVLGPAAGYVGWKSGQVEYTSSASIHVKPVLTRIMFNSEEKGVPPMFDSYVNTQAQLLKNPRVVDMAVQDPRWQQSFGKATAEAVADFINHIIVTRRDELVVVSVTNHDPGVARTGVTTLVQAYKRLFVEQDSQEDEQRISTLQQRRTTLTNEAAAIRQQILAIAGEYGTEDLSLLNNKKIELMTELEQEISHLRMGAAPTTGPAASTQQSDVRRAAAIDPMVATLVTRRDNLALEESMSRTRLGSQNPQRLRMVSELEAVNAQIKARVTEMKDQGLMQQLSDPVVDPVARRKQLEELLTTTREAQLAIGRKSLTLEGLKQEEKRLRDDINQCRSRIDELMLESSNAGRLQVLSEGDMPVEPSKDSRKRNAAAAAAAAALLSLSVVITRGMLDNEVHGLEDVPSVRTMPPMLGVLPEIPNGLDAQNLASQAAHNLHHIRTMLEIWARNRIPLTLTLTSPSAGSGKTSLTLSLGVSFAAAGLRTLLIDLDLIGGGLTTRIDAMIFGRMGDLLVANGVLTEVQRVEAVKLATASGSRLSDACVRLGYATLEQVMEATREVMADESAAGVLEAIDGAPIQDCVRQTGVKSLWVLSLGRAELEDAATVSPNKVRRLVQAAREHYDVILVDTGPAPGSIEAGAAAASTDGVVVAVAMGESRAAIRACCDYLIRAGATLAGLVFNRANVSDVIRHSTSRMSSSVYRSVPRLMPPSQERPPAPAGGMIPATAEVVSAKMGPIAGAVVSSVTAKSAATGKP
jgi:polysaccharide biosynthesis transport protein